ncbi:hypothetical protein D3C87_88450 [compost metagenome]
MMKKIFVSTIAFTFVCSSVFAQVQGIESKGNSKNGGSVNDSANKSSSGNGTAQITSLITGGMMFTKSYQHFSRCGPPGTQSECVLGAMFAGLGALSMMQASENGSAKNSANMTAGLSDGLGNTDPYATGNYDPEISNSGVFKSAESSMNKLKDKGLFDPKTNVIKGPDGKTYKVDDFTSSDKMAQAGIPQGAIDSVMDYAAYASKKAEGEAGKVKLGALTEANGYAEGGGGGGSGDASGSGGYSDDSQFGSTARSGSGLSALNRDPAQVAGMQKNYNGEPIGVAADSIFLMMNRRYKVKEGQDSFYSEMDMRVQK